MYEGLDDGLGGLPAHIWVAGEITIVTQAKAIPSQRVELCGVFILFPFFLFISFEFRFQNLFWPSHSQNVLPFV